MKMATGKSGDSLLRISGSDEQPDFRSRGRMTTTSRTAYCEIQKAFKKKQVFLLFFISLRKLHVSRISGIDIAREIFPDRTPQREKCPSASG